MFIFSKARFEKGKTSKLPFIIHIPSSQKNFIGQQCFLISKFQNSQVYYELQTSSYSIQLILNKLTRNS
ncbi:hypothetical protein Gilli_0049 [Gillisia limnaea DSM 15749]|uniref:Uncharacterized protein n=1 Tax=Gillisia limnaea (strain DSM 15749 / LMG 21470 / R-8282) TaxID=865937 RepID=H2BQN8_GILLR|nr:hypothetical protein Gilli_0049 [Gillisia limnaea DSM 15749]